MNKSESITKLAISLAMFNGEVSSISKDAVNPFFKSDYVTLDKLIIATRDILQKNGLSILQMPLSKENEIGIQTILLHESGEYIETEPLFMKPVKNDPQGAGSLITYLRRYSYQSILNLNTGEDNDGNSSSYISTSNEKEPATKYTGISEAQYTRLLSIAHTKNIKPSQVAATTMQDYKKPNPMDLNKKEYDEIIKKIQAK